jgi:hypothetical protein
LAPVEGEDGVTSAEVIEALRRRHGRPGYSWAFFSELRCGTGWSSRGVRNPEQRIDAWAISLWPSRGVGPVAYEVKVSRADWLRELKQPRKRKQAMALSQEFFIAAPAGIVRPDELPEGCGLIEVTQDLTSRVVAAAPQRPVADPPWQFVAAIARRVVAEEQSTGRLPRDEDERGVAQ